MLLLNRDLPFTRLVGLNSTMLHIRWQHYTHFSVNTNGVAVDLRIWHLLLVLVLCRAEFVLNSS